MLGINFNSNEFTPLSEKVKEAMKNAVELYDDARPDSYGHDNKIAALISESKYSIAEWLNAQAYDIFYCNGALQVEIDIINWAVMLLNVERIICSPFESESKLDYLKHLAENGKIELHILKTSEFGIINIDDLKNILNTKSSGTLISLSHANKFTGVLLPVKDIALLAKQNQAFFHLNAGLTIGKYRIDLSKIETDFLTFDSILENGPTGTGVLLLNESIAIANNLYQKLVKLLQSCENKNPVLISGMTVALQDAFDDLIQKQKNISELKTYFIAQLDKKMGLKTVDASLKKKGLFNQLAFFVSKEEFGKYFIEKLDLNGFIVSHTKYPVKIKDFVDYHYINLSLSEQITQKQVDAFLGFIQNHRK